jgi:hypothetical protein
MRSPIQAIVWEIWGANRRGWLVIFAAIAAFTTLCRLLPQAVQKSEGLQEISVLFTALMLCLTMAIFNFTEVNPRKGFAGFPQRLFTMPVRTCWLVGYPMLCGVAGVVALYVAWTELVFRPVGFAVMVRWPATLLAAAVVFYQAIIWCLSGYRIARLFVLGFVLTYLVAVGFIPHLPPALLAHLAPGLRGVWTEEKLTVVLAALMLGAYGAAVVAVGNQRRGGGRTSLWRTVLAQRLTDAFPHRQWKLNSPERALFWMEWRRSGLVLPAAVLFVLLVFMGPLSGAIGPNAAATDRVTFWVVIMPMLLAIVIGKGVAKPDFWSLELGLSPFLTARPISAGQIVAAKMKSAAASTLLTWGLLLAIAPLWIYCTGNLEHLQNVWGLFRQVYSPWVQWMIPILLLVAAMTLTWSLMIGSLWLGYSGRPALYYSGVGLAVVVFVSLLIALGACLDLADDDNAAILTMLPWLPWALAAAFILKVWSATAAFLKARRHRLMSDSAVRNYLGCWAAATGCFVMLAWLMSSRIAWLRDFLLLAALLAVPLARLGTAPLMVAWNRHR